MLRYLAFALLMILLPTTEIGAQQPAAVSRDTVPRDRCAHMIANLEFYQSCQAGFHDRDSIHLEILRSKAQREKEQELGLPTIGVLAVLTVIALFLSRNLESQKRLVPVALMLVFVAAVLAIFNTETAGAFGAAFTAAAGAVLAGKAR